MNTELTDKQLERAIWMYEHRPLFVRYMLYASGALCAILVIIFFIFTVQLIFFQLQRVDFLKNSQQIILYTDPALAFQPLDLDVSEFLVVRHPQRGADFGVKVINANAKWYAFLYDFMFVVDGKQGIAQNGFALPGTTYLAGFLSKEEPFTQATIEIHNVKWKRIVPIKDEERLRLTNFDTAQTAFIAGDKISTIDRVVSTLYNNSPFGFWNVEVIVFAYKGNDLVAVGKTSIEKIASGERRLIEVGLGMLPVSIATVDRIEIIPSVNVLDDAAIL